MQGDNATTAAVPEPSPVSPVPAPVPAAPPAPGFPLPSPWVASLAVAAVASLTAVIQLGRLHPDEVYQFLEPAWYRAHGYGVLAWEWQVGLRNWAIPLFFSALVRLADLVHLTHPRAYRVLLEVPQFFLHAWMLLAVYRYTERRVGARWAYGSLLLVGLYGVVVAFGGRTLGETFSAAFIVIGAEALDRPGRPISGGLLAGAMFGLSVVARYGSGVLVAGAVLWLLAAAVWETLRTREGRWRLWRSEAWKRWAFTCLAGLAIAVALGALDWITWTRPFQSFRNYWQFNVGSEGAARRFGSEPWTYYLPALAGYPPIWVWPGLVLAVWRQRPKLPLLLFLALSYVGVVDGLTPHKEMRFLYPALVCLAVAAAPGVLDGLRALTKPWLRASLGAVALAASLATLFVPGDLQPQRGDQFRAIVSATRPPEVTGLLVVNEGIWGAGGFFYIGKNIPWLNADWPAEYGFQMAMRDARFNRVVSYDGRAVPELKAAGFHVIDQIGNETVLAR